MRNPQPEQENSEAVAEVVNASDKKKNEHPNAKKSVAIDHPEKQ